LSARRLWPVIALAALLGLTSLVATPSFWPVDETSHVAYADHILREGNLPQLDTPIPTDAAYPGLVQRLHWERDQFREGRQDIWTSNHPPLPYLVQAVALGTGRAIGDGRLAMVLARLTSVAWLCLGVLATVRLAFLLAPAGRTGRRARLEPQDVAYAAGALVAVTPTLTHLSGLVFNDVPAFTMSTLCLLVGARAAFAGLTPQRLALLGLVGGAAAITRVSCLPAVAVMGLLALYGWWRDPAALRGPAVTRSAVTAVLAFTPAACFWARNVVLYGDLTAADALFTKFDRDLNTPVDELVGDHVFWLRLWNRMWADLTTGHWAVGTRAQITAVLWLLLILATAVALTRAVRHLLDLPRRSRRRRRRSAAPAGRLLDLAGDRGEAGLPVPVPALLPGWARQPSWGPPVARALAAHPRRVVWAVGSLLPLSLLVSAVEFHSAGGSLHGRYLLGGHALVAVAIVLALDGLPRVGRTLAVGVVVPIFITNLALVRALQVHGGTTWDRVGIHLVLPSLAGDGAAGIVTALQVGAAALVLLVVVQHRRPRRSRRSRGGGQPAASTDGAGVARSPRPRRAIRASAAR
jgi:4-amino-4-deoxy-L-arabinose transferase-like glycosyltransferase